MTATHLYTQKLMHPESIGGDDIIWLENIIQNYPYFQSARALYLKGLYEQRSHLYNNELKKTAAYSTDRDVLFDLITSDKFTIYQPMNISDIQVIDEILIQRKPSPTLEENIEKSVLSTIAYIENTEKEDQLITKLDQKAFVKEVEAEIQQEKISEETALTEIKNIEQELEVGKPLSFEKNEKHTFSEWLQLTKAQPIDRSENSKAEEKKEIKEVDKRTKTLELIDRFIETNPKIIPSKQPVAPPAFIERNENNQMFLMTETLAKIYLEQKKYQKAIQAYEILILKYPEKSSLFADRIQHIKKLQQYNS